MISIKDKDYPEVRFLGSSHTMIIPKEFLLPVSNRALHNYDPDKDILDIMMDEYFK